MKVALVSLNGLHELSGGGLYLRSIVGALCKVSSIKELLVISKEVQQYETASFPQHCRTHFLPKTLFSDLSARAFLSPTFLGHYFPILWDLTRNADIVLFHNSRCGVILRKMQRRAPEKVFGILSDNVESALKDQHPATGLGSRMAKLIEVYAIRRAERFCLGATFMTFITQADRMLFRSMYGNLPQTKILPIAILDDKAPVITTHCTVKPYRILFTGHFGFSPNKKALEDYAAAVKIFRQISDLEVEFVVAGAQASSAEKYPGLTIIESPSAEEMSNIFASTSVYLAPVSWGSGMKTKVAEALSYGLPVLCFPNAAQGYEETLSDQRLAPAVEVVDTAELMAKMLREILSDGSLAQRRVSAKTAFAKLYSLESQIVRFEKLFNFCGDTIANRHMGQ